MVLPDHLLIAAVKSDRLRISPFSAALVQPASIDVRLGDEFRIFNNHGYSFIDPREETEGLTSVVKPPDGEPFILHPGEFALGSTVETIGLPADLVARLEGRSSLGRLGLVIHSTAGWIDAGFSGQITLELSNAATLPIKLWPGMTIGQLSVLQMAASAQRPYGDPGLKSKYQGQIGPTASENHRNFDS